MQRHFIVEVPEHAESHILGMDS